MLEVEGLDAFYGDFQALFDIGFTQKSGETLALIGANGAGKSSLLHSICGLTSETGTIRLNGAEIGKLPPKVRAELGVSLSPEGRRMFSSLTVRENLQIGANTGRPGPWSLDRVTELFPILEEFANRPASLLSGGQQQMVAIGRALMANPDLLLLDEVSLGLAPVVAEEVMAALASIRGESQMMTILVEQDVSRAIAASDCFVCLLEGRVVLDGVSEGADLGAIGHAYFGEDDA
ncbi:ABC transporter ATP-binding protein [Lentibacter algarum]|uniref:ABC transporter ATP-binding protein n=1 Tax=Lentibacter algarum TaxID=576131 RepID=UPI001C0713E6|nr:ABC transporter ATP-binding protein [Lentibacter algarum]MBU2981847.1 ABC transporter ATP-binding protein [Lentibacter algarum]